ncbi:MAG: glucan biosynthesis protein G [Pseudomonadota bacterium]
MLGLLATAASARVAQAAGGDGEVFSEAWLREKARELASQPFEPRAMVPEEWRDLTYDQYRSIWFDSREAEWKGTDRPYRVDFFAPGLYFERAVEVNLVEEGMARRIPFDLGRFDKTDQFPELPMPEDLGYSGFRLRAELRERETFEEFCVFQGASYFRAIGTGQAYGLSARGLAVKTADPSGEEFPDFTRFWIEAPHPEEETIRVHALLDGPSVAGAYRFDITPGLPARMEVAASLFMREGVSNVGIAPLTSMFLFDETNRSRFDDFRSAVHDSEGILIENGAGERIWRPLANPRRLQISAFMDKNPKGFGLVQRSRALEDYADLEAHYHERPTLWVTPGEDWGEGTVNLVEIPSDKEIYDNIVAYWRPGNRLEPEIEHRFSYRLDWGEDPGDTRARAPVLKTRIGKGYDKAKPGSIIAIDFGTHPAFDDLETLTHVVTSTRGTTTAGILQRNPATGGIRLSFRFDPGAEEIAELRAQLLTAGQTISEVWLYRWTA